MSQSVSAPGNMWDAEDVPLPGFEGEGSGGCLGEHPAVTPALGNKGAAMRLNLGCGRRLLENFVNVDLASPGHTPDVVLDLDNATRDEWIRALEPIAAKQGRKSLVEESGWVEFAQFIHVLEHLKNPLRVMENLWNVSKPGAICYIRCPHGASDDAWEDPTHVRPYYPGSFMYFAQPTYWRADYGYRGDWRVVKIDLLATHPQMAQNVNYAMLGRNSVSEMVTTLECVKPARPPDRELMDEVRPTFKAGQ